MISEERSALPLPWLAALILAAWVLLIVWHFASPVGRLPVESIPSPTPAEILNPNPGDVS
jgi:hypothetical protein